MGTAVIRAYRAQSNSCLGFRIFLHPSAVGDASVYPWLYVKLPEPEITDECSQELNFVDREPHNLYPRPPVYTVYEHFQKMMSEHCPGDQLRVSAHYKATDAALKRLESLSDEHGYWR